MDEPRRVLETNIKIILHDILLQLGLHRAEFGIYVVTNDEVKAYIDINGIPNVPCPVRFIGTPATRIGPSQQNAARQALKFLQQTYNIYVGDYNYYQLKLEEHNYKQLLQQMPANFTKLKL